MATCKESYRERQESELEVLRSIFDDNVVDLRAQQEKWIPLELKIKLEPSRSSKASEAFCSIVLHLICPKNYPKVTPKIILEDAKGISNSEVSSLLNQLNKEAYGLKGEVMIFELCQLVQAFLHERNIPPKGSFYDEMLARKQKKDQDEITQMRAKEEKIRQQLHDEVLKRKEQLRRENRIRRSTLNESPMRHISSGSSSESRMYGEFCDEHKRSETIYFPLDGRKILQGACLGHSLKGCVNYSGIDLATGKLYYLTEWDIKYSLLESKSLQVDHVVESIEKKVANLSKLRHKNLIGYEGVLCTKKKENILTVTLVQEFLHGISICCISGGRCWNWSVESISTIAKGILEALVFLHNNGVSHNNLLDSSVFLDTFGNIKVTDYSIVPYLQELITEEQGSPDLPALGSLIEALIPSGGNVEMRSFISECKSERTLSATNLLEHPFLYTNLLNLLNTDSHSQNDQKFEASCPPPVQDKALSNVNLSTVAPLVSSDHSRLNTEFDIVMNIGKGAYGDVLKVRNRLDNRYYAIKRIPISSRNMQLYRKLTREVELLSRLNHENVVRYYNSWMETQTEDLDDSDEDGLMINRKKSIIKTHSRNQLKTVSSSSESLNLGMKGAFIDDSSSESDDDDYIQFVDSQNRAITYSDNSESESEEEEENRRKSEVVRRILYIQMEFCDKSTLRSVIDANLYLDRERVWKLFREIVEGLVHIHQQGMIHRDLKCENIFLDSRDHVKIGDFGLATTNVLALQYQSAMDNNQSLSATNSNLTDPNTGLVGTALYCAPELSGNASKSVYNQKVDVYSLGIIFFEMCHPPFETGMERIQTISKIRNPDVALPTDMLNNEKCKNEVQLLNWLLDHNPSKRPTSEELLQSELMPPAKLEANELQEMLRHVLANPQSRNYKYLISRMIQQESDKVMNNTYHLGMVQVSSIFENVKIKIEQIFRKHGGIDVSLPLLTPYIKLDSDSVVRLMTHSGSIVTLPYDLRHPFLRFVAMNNINLLRRYSIGRVYKEKKVFNFHPKQSFQCAFDIVSPTRGYFLVDAELLLIANEIINEFEVLRQKNFTFKINHTSLLRAIFLHYSVPSSKYKALLKLVTDYSEGKISRFQLQSSVTSLLPSSKSQSVNSLVDTLTISDVSIANINSTHLKVLIKGRGEAAQLAKGAVRELETVINLSQAMGVNIAIHICVGLSMNYDCTRSGSILWQMRGELKQGRQTVIACGGRHDYFFQDYQNACQDVGMPSHNREIYSAGFSMAMDKLVLGLSQLSDTDSSRAVVDLVVFASGLRPPLKDVITIMKTLWATEIKCCFIESQEDDNIARGLGANHIVVLDENGGLRIKSWNIDRYHERYVTRTEAIEYLKRTLSVESVNIPLEPSHLVRNNSVSSMSNENNISGLPSLEVIYRINEKNSGRKKRINNQIEQKLSGVLQKFCKKETIVIYATELDAKEIRALLGCIDPNPKEQSQVDFENVLKGSLKSKHEQLLDIYEEITEKLSKNKNSAIIGIYGVQDSYYRLIL